MTTEEKLVWSDLAIHPGESLAEELEFRGTSVDELAAQSGLSAQLLDKIVRGEKPITATVARTLAAFLEIPAQFWLNLQTKHDLSVSRNKSTGSSVSTSGRSAATGRRFSHSREPLTRPRFRMARVTSTWVTQLNDRLRSKRISCRDCQLRPESSTHRTPLRANMLLATSALALTNINSSAPA